MYEAARMGDTIGHSGALSGMLVGTLTGALVTAAGGVVSGVLLATGLAAACLGVGLLLAGAALAIGWLSGELATAARDSIAVNGERRVRKRGVIRSGSCDVLINGKPAALASRSQVHCDDDGHSMHLAEGSASVTINGLPASRINDRTSCDGRIITGSRNVLIGGLAVKTTEITPEVPEWLYQASDLTLLFSGLIGGGAAVNSGALARAFSKLPGINHLGRLLCRAGALMTGAAAVGIVARPVDVVSGQKFLNGEDECDFTLPSRLPVTWQRCWRSGNPGDSVLGRGWNLFWESWLEPYQHGLVWRAPSGDYVAFPRVPPGYRSWCPAEKRWLEQHSDGSWSVYGTSGERWHYPALQGDAPARLAQISDPCGNATRFSWHADHRLRALTDSAGLQVVCRYQDNRLSGVWLDDDICLVSYRYDADGQLTEVRGRGDRLLRRYGWQDGLLVSHEDASGLLNEYRWQETDGLPRVTQYRNSAGEQLDFHYDFPGGVRRVLRDDGAEARWQLDDDDHIAAYTAFDGRRTALLYDDGELCGALLPGGALRRTQWDKYGRLVADITPSGLQTLYHWYRLSDRISAVIHPDGSAEHSEYDKSLRQTAYSDALRHTTRWHYPAADDPLPDAITDPGGNRVALRWNPQGLLTQYTDCSGGVTRYTYDRYGLLLSVEDAAGHLTRLEYNAAGQLTAQIYPDGSREQWIWNARGQLAAWRDQAGSETCWQYNSLGQAVNITDRLGRQVSYAFDPRGNLLQLVNGNGSEYRFVYDPEGRLLQETRPDSTIFRYDYNAAGQLCAQHQPGAVENIHYFRYNADGQRVWRVHRHAEFVYRYDKRSRLTELLRQPTAAGLAIGIDSSHLRFAYDAVGRLVSESNSCAVSAKLRYQWDHCGNLSALTLPGGQQLSWLYYGSGHCAAMKFNQQLLSEFTRNRLQRETVRSQGCRLQQREYDSLGHRILQRSDAGKEISLRRHYHYDIRGELVGVSDTLRGDIYYGYDAEGRLIQHHEPRRLFNAVFSYDAADNLTNDPSAISDNRLLRRGNLHFRYQDNGNLSRRRAGWQEQRYEYDADNQLVQAHGSGPQGQFSAHYHYDALGRRIRKTVTSARGHSETRFLWQGYRLLQEQSASGNCRTYAYDPQEHWSPLAAIDHPQQNRLGEVFWFSTDLNGAPLEVTDAQGDVCWSGQYDSFGEVNRQCETFRQMTAALPLAHQPLRYTGQYADAETGLHYNLFRYYDPQVGRFTTPDPVGLAGGLNLYAYAPNPLGWIDPYGLTTRRTEFRAAKSHAGIPKSSQYETHKYVYDNKFENRTVYQFNVNKSKKYVILHEEGPFGRGPHFHGADDTKGNPMEPGKYNQLKGHHPENMAGYGQKKKGSCS